MLTVLLSFYLAQTLASPIMQLAGSAAAMRQGEGRTGSVPLSLLSREDEIGILARDLQRAARDLWARIDTNERFAADVAHELRNPLTSVRSAIETLRRIENPEQQRRLLGIIAEDAVRMDRLIADISDSLARGRGAVAHGRGAGGRGADPLDPGRAARGDAGRGRSRRWRWKPRRPASWCAAWRGGWCRCSATCSATRSPSARATAPCASRRGRPGAWVEVVVEDEGPGIPEAKLEGIFERFYSERPQGEGFGKHSGLGLSISRQIVEGLRGRIAAENRRDAEGKVVGARFIVRLPAG